MTYRTLHSDLSLSLLDGREFQYAHLVKFEKPIASLGAIPSRDAKTYKYITDCSFDITWDDGSVDAEGNANNAQTYRARSLQEVSNISDSVEAKAASINIKLTASALGNAKQTSITVTSTTITMANSVVEDNFIDAGFAEGDDISFSDGPNVSRIFRLERFTNNNKTAYYTIVEGTSPATNETAQTRTISLASKELSGIILDKGAADYTNYINREVYIYKAHIAVDDSVSPYEAGDIIGEPFLLFKGIIESGRLTEDPTKETSVSWSITSHWGDFVTVIGRLTSDEAHRALTGKGAPDIDACVRPEYASDFGFMHSEQAINLISTYKAKEIRYKTKSRGGVAGLLGGKKLVEYEVEVDREVDLKLNLTARYLPVVYGVQKVDSIPVFVDTLDNDSATVFVAYAICEGEVHSLYDVYFDDESSICLSEMDQSAREGTDTATVQCIGRMDRGDVLSGDTSVSGNISYVAVPEYTAANIAAALAIALYVPGVDMTTYDPVTGYFINPAQGNVNSTSALGIGHEKSTTFKTPLNTWLNFHSGKPNQKADILLVDTANSQNFHLQNHYFNDAPGNYWSPAHRLLDTAYAVAKYEIAEGETELPALDFVVKGRIIECYNYDYSYLENPAIAPVGSPPNFQIGDTVTLGDGATGTATIAWIEQIAQANGTTPWRVRFASDPSISSTAFSISNGTDKIYFATYDAAYQTTTVAEKLIENVTGTAPGSTTGVNVTVASGTISAIAGMDIRVALLTTYAYDVERASSFSTSNTSASTTLTDIGGTSVDRLAITDVIVRNAVKLSAGSAVDDIYNDLTIIVTRVLSDGSIYEQVKTIVDYDGTTKVAITDTDFHPDYQPDVNDTVKVLSAGDKRVSSNGPMQLLDYATNKRFGRGLDVTRDINLPTWLESARKTDTRSRVRMTVSTAGVVDGAVYKFADNGLKFQGTVDGTPTDLGGGLYEVIFTDVIGKLCYKWNDWRIFKDGDLVWWDGGVYSMVGTGTLPNAPSGSPNATIQLTKVSGSGPTSVTVDTTESTFDGNPVIKEWNATQDMYVTGYELYDSDDVKYWRYLNWESPEQEYVTRHQTNIVINTSNSVFDNINQFLGHFNGILRYNAGKYDLDIRSAKDPDQTIGSYTPSHIQEEDIIGPLNIEDSGSKKTFNHVSCNLVDPANKFDGRAATFLNSTYLKQDRNIVKKGNVKTPGITNYFNARLNARQYLEESRYGLSVNFLMHQKGALLLPGTIITITYPRLGFATKPFRVSTVTIKANGLVQINAEEHTDTAYIIEGTQIDSGGISHPTPGPANRTTPNPVTVFNTTRLQGGGIELTWDYPTGYLKNKDTFEIYRSTQTYFSGSPAPTLIATVDGNNYTDNPAGDISTVQTYFYWIRTKRTHETSGVVFNPNTFSSYYPDKDSSPEPQGIVGSNYLGLSNSVITLAKPSTILLVDENTSPDTVDYTGTDNEITVSVNGVAFDFDNTSPQANSTFNVTIHNTINLDPPTISADVTSPIDSTKAIIGEVSNFTEGAAYGQIIYLVNIKDALGNSYQYLAYQTCPKIVGTTGTDATIRYLEIDSPVIFKDAPDVTTDGTHTSINVTGKQVVGNGTPTTYGYATITANGDSEAGTATVCPLDTFTPANDADKLNYTVRLYNDAAKTTLLDTQVIPVVFKGATGDTGAAGSPGADGTAGYNTATLYAYKRSATDLSAVSPPDNPGTLTYTFSSASWTPANGWSKTIPAQTSPETPVWAVIATAYSNTPTDQVNDTDWTTPVQVFSDGTDGSNGAPGLNVATVYIYQRTNDSNAPSLPSGSPGAVYTFATGGITGLNNGWTEDIPAFTGSNLYLWVTIATASSTSSTDTIDAGEWQTARILSQNGTDGTNALAYYISPLNGTAIKNSTGTLTLEAHKIDGASDTALTTGTIQLYTAATEIFSDDFNRGDSSDPSTQSPAEYVGWGGDPTFRILSNRAASPVAGGAWSSTKVNPGTSYSDIEIEFTVYNVQNVGISEFSVQTRVGSFSPLECYDLNVYAGKVWLYKYVSGTKQQPAIGSYEITTGTIDDVTIKYVQKGSSHTIYVDGIERISQTDATYSSGEVAMYFYTEGSVSPPIVCSMDNFYIRNASTLVTAANGFVTGSDGYTGILDSGDINDSITIALKNGIGGTLYDTLTLVDVTDGASGSPGTPGSNAVYGYIEPTGALMWTRAANQITWTPNTDSVQLDVTFVQAGSVVARDAYQIDRDGDGILTYQAVAGSPELNPSRITITPSGTGTQVATVKFDYSYNGDTASVSETVATSMAGADGAAGSPGAAGENAIAYYISPLTGTAIKNSTGTLTLEAHKADGASDTALTTGTIQLYTEGPTLFADDFNRADSADPNTQSPGEYVTIPGSTIVRILNNKAASPATANGENWTQITSDTYDDIDIEATIYNIQDGNNIAAFSTRVQAFSPFSAYDVYIWGDTVGLQRYDGGGGSTVLATYQIPGGYPIDQVTLRFVQRDDVHKVYVDGVERISYTDAAGSPAYTSGYIAMYLLTNNASPPDVTSLDNLTIKTASLLVTAANGFVTGSDGYTGILDAGDINNSVVIGLKDGIGGTLYDTISLVDITDGAAGSPGEHAVYGYIEPSAPLAWIRASDQSTWTPSGTTVDLDVTFVQNGTEVGRHRYTVTNASDGTLTAAAGTHPGGNDLTYITGSPNPVVSGYGTSTLSVTWTYDDGTNIATVGETVTTALSGVMGSSAHGLVLNGGFETGDSTNWRAFPASASVVTGNPYSGTYSARLLSGTGGPNIIANSIPVNAGEIYRLTAYVKRDESFLPTADITLNVRQYDATNSAAGFFTDLDRGYSATSGWQTLVADYVIPTQSPAVAYISLDVGESAGDNAGYWFVDDCSLVPKSANSVVATLDNSSHVVPSDPDGSNPVMDQSGTDIFVIQGDTYLSRVTSLTAANQFTVSPSVTFGTISVGSVSAGTSPNRAIVADHTGFTSDSAAITYTIVARDAYGIDQTFYLLQSLTKAKKGTTGDTGNAGSSLALVASPNIMPYDKYDDFTGTEITFTVNKNNITNNQYDLAMYRLDGTQINVNSYITNISDGTNTNPTRINITDTTWTLTETNFTNARSTTNGVILEVSNSTDNVSDRVTINKLKEGQTGLGPNLITNGYAELGSNYNFRGSAKAGLVPSSSATYTRVATGGPTGGPYFQTSVLNGSTIYGEEHFIIDPTKLYEWSAWQRYESGTFNSNVLVGWSCLDQNKAPIAPHQCWRIQGVDCELYATPGLGNTYIDVKPHATLSFLEWAQTMSASTTGSLAIVFNASADPDDDIPMGGTFVNLSTAQTFYTGVGNILNAGSPVTVNSAKLEDFTTYWRVKLTSGYTVTSGMTNWIVSGSPSYNIGFSGAGSTHQYMIYATSQPPATWVQHTKLIKGINDKWTFPSPYKLRRGTRSVCYYASAASGSSIVMNYANISMKEIPSDLVGILDNEAVTLSASTNGQLESGDYAPADGTFYVYFNGEDVTTDCVFAVESKSPSSLVTTIGASNGQYSVTGGFNDTKVDAGSSPGPYTSSYTPVNTGTVTYSATYANGTSSAVVGTIYKTFTINKSRTPATNVTWNQYNTDSGADTFLYNSPYVKQTASGGSWESALISSEAYTGGAFISGKVESGTLQGMFGFMPEAQHPATGHTADTSPYISSDFNWYPQITTGTLLGRYDGTQPAYTGTYSAGDVLALNYDGQYVHYIKNGTIVASRQATPGKTYWGFVQPGQNNFVLKDIVFAGSASAGLKNYTVTLYQRSNNTTAPTTNTAAISYNFSTKAVSGTPNNGWSTSLPAADGTTFIWISIGTIVESYPGSNTGSTSTFSAGQQLTSSGEYVDIRFKRSYAPPTAPTVAEPTDWFNGVPTGTETLWTTSVRKSYGNVLLGNWSTPSRVGAVTYRGSYVSGTTYYQYDVVYYNGSSYICSQETNVTGSPPTYNPPSGTNQGNTYWDVFASEGDPGEPGDPPAGFTDSYSITTAADTASPPAWEASPSLINLRSIADANGYTGLSDATITYTITGNRTGTAAAYGNPGGRAITTGTWPSGYTVALTLNINASVTVWGGGGRGGPGGGDTGAATGYDGSDGGDAIYLEPGTYTIDINNSGAIKCGYGGGGGGGASMSWSGGSESEARYAGGGGGGGGMPNGLPGYGGSSYLSTSPNSDGADGTAGSTSNEGTGGAGGTHQAKTGGDGGDGGGSSSSPNVAESGGSGTGGTYNYSGGDAGGNGYAVRRNGHTETSADANGTYEGTWG